MSKSKVIAGLAGLMLCASGALASGSVSHRRTLNVNGTFTVLSAPNANVDAVTGACNASAWVDVCSGTNCSCIEITASSASGNMDTGSQTVSNFFITSDESIDPATTNQPVVPGLAGNCHPVRGVAMDSVSSTGETKTLNLIGASCQIFNGISNANPGGTTSGHNLAGAWSIDGVSAPSPAASGWGVVWGSFTNATGAAVVGFKGLVSE